MGERQPLRKQTSSVQDEVYPSRESNLRPNIEFDSNHISPSIWFWSNHTECRDQFSPMHLATPGPN